MIDIHSAPLFRFQTSVDFLALAGYTILPGIKLIIKSGVSDLIKKFTITCKCRGAVSYK